MAVVVSLAVPGAALGRTFSLGTGVLRDAGLVPAAGTVEVYPWSATPRAAHLRPLAVTRAGADGRFAVTARSSAALTRLARRARSNGGWAQFLVYGQTAHRAGWSAFSRRLATARSGAVASSAGRPAVKPLSVDAIGSLPARATAASAASPACGAYEKKVGYAKRHTTVGELNNAYHDTRSSFIYGRGQQADSDIGFEQKVAGGAFAFESFMHVATTDIAEVGPVGYRGPFSARVWSNFYYGEYRLRHCAPGARTFYVVKPELWAGGTGFSSQTSPSIHNCTGGDPYPGGGIFKRESRRAVTWARSAVAFGARVRAHSGFSKFVITRFHFGGPRRRNHVLCGSHGKPATVAPRIYSGRAHS